MACEWSDAGLLLAGPTSCTPTKTTIPAIAAHLSIFFARFIFNINEGRTRISVLPTGAVSRAAFSHNVARASEHTIAIPRER
jgi:hypothetical protein